jgi:hypothetical protein
MRGSACFLPPVYERCKYNCGMAEMSARRTSQGWCGIALTPRPLRRNFESRKRIPAIAPGVVAARPRRAHVRHGNPCVYLYLFGSRYTDRNLEGVRQGTLGRVGNPRKNSAGCSRKNGTGRLHPSIHLTRKPHLLPHFGAQISDHNWRAR